MVYSVNNNATFAQEQAKTSGAEPMYMYALNASKTGVSYLYYVNYNHNVYGYQLDANGDTTAATQLYTGLPIALDVITTETSGEISDVNVSIPNVDRIAETFIQTQDYLRGKEVYIMTGFAKHLPQGDGANYLGNLPDRNAIIKERLFVDSASSDENAVTFSCKPKFTIKHVYVPGRTFARECSWALKARYAASECDPLASVDTTTYPTCDGSLDNCRLRNNIKRYGGFPSIPRKGITIV
jgi:phage-related protein